MLSSDNVEYPSAETTQDIHKFALVVGVNNSYASSPLASLKYAEDDAIEVYRTLRQDDCGFSFLDPVLTGSKAGTAEVRSAIIRLVDEKTDRDFLLFYFIGHAQPVKTKHGYSDIYFVTHNFNPKEVKKDTNSHLSMRWLRDILYQPDGAGGVLIILDCCYAGNMIEGRPDSGLIDVRKIVEECLDGPVIKYQNGRLRVILTATGYNTPAQERVMTSLVLSALQGKEQQAIDDKGDVNIHSLYTYLQNQMSQEQLPNLSGEFARKCILAHYPEKSSDHLQQLRRAVEDERWNKVSNLMNRISEVSETITDPNYFRRLAEANLRYHMQQFDRLIEEGASIADLNQEMISEFFKTDLVLRQDDFIRGASYQDQLRQFGLLQKSHPTYGALLSFGMNPTRWLAGAFTHCTLWPGNDRHPGWKEAQDYQRDLVTQFELSRDFLRKNLRLSRVIGRDDRIQELEIPLVALGEALANALVHREYANQTSPVYVDIFNDRVEISSPGVPPEPMSMELLQEEHKSHPRNPQIARIFYLYGHVEKVGTGIQRIQRSLEEAGLSPAQFELGRDKTFKAIFYRPDQVLEDSAQSKYFYAKNRHVDSSDHLVSMLERCTVRLSTPSESGTGFFVAPGLILTCAHVVGDSQSNQTTVMVEWEDQTYYAKILRVLPSYPNLALLKLEDALATHPCVLLHEAVQVRDELYSYGYTKDYPHGEPATFEVEGKTGDPIKLLTFKLGRVIEGFSGAPLLNRRTGCVCGVLSITRGQNTLLGGRGIPTSVILEQFKELVTLQREFHDKDRRWYDLLPESEVKQFSWQELGDICSKITERRMSTVRDKYSEGLYLRRDHAHRAFMQFLEDPTKRGFVLIGKSGVGKSNFLLALRGELQAREDVCVLMYDAGSPMEYPLMETIDEDFHEQVGWPIQQLWEKIKRIDGIDKRLVLFCVDALNEHEQPRSLLKQLNELIQKPWPWLKVVIVSRPEAWQSIKRRLKLAETLYYREEGETPGAISESFNYSERLEPFSRRELPLVYTRYQRKYQVQTPYEDLSSRLRDIISDPFNLWLVTNTSKDKAIPEHLKATTLIENYMNALTVEGERLQGGDPDWLEYQLVPLMVSEGHYEKSITSEELDTADHALYRALLDRADSSGLPRLQSFINLVDADILKREPRGIGFAIAFKSERFYNYFVGRRLFQMGEAQADRYNYFLDMNRKTTERPYLWGAVRNALVQEAEQPDIEIVLKLCRTPDQHVREMMVSVLTTLGADTPQQVERILKELVPVVRRATTIKKVRQWQGKASVDAGRPTRNAGRTATEVASNLNLPWLLQAAALQEDSTIRTEAVRFAYHLWRRDHQAGFAILEHLTREITSNLIPEKAALESTIGLSMSIFFDSYQDEQVLRRLQGFWHDIIARMLAGEHGKLWERILRHLFFPPRRIFSTVINLVVGYIDGLPDYGEAFNYPALEAFFHLGTAEKALYTRLVSYIDVEGNYSREQMERDFLAVMRQTNNYLIVFMVRLGLIAHACQDPFAFLPFLQRFYEEAKRDVVAYPYMNDVIHVLDNVLHRGPMDDALFDFFVFAVEECQEFYIRHPEAIRNRHYRTKPEVHDLGPYIFHVYRKTGSVKTAWLETRIQSALARGDTRFFELLLMSELSLIGIERQSPKAALLTVAMFFQQGNVAIRTKTQEFLAHLRAYYPNEVDEFLEEQDADDDFRVQVQIHEPEEDIAMLIGQRSLYFLRDDIILRSPTLRSRLLSLLTKAADCRNIRVWLDYFLRELINLLYGGEILHLPE